MWSEATDDGTIWVYGYGSLMWRPGFPHQEAIKAVLPDYSRSFCIWSEHHRGTRGCRGLVLGLAPQPGAHCEGMAFRIDPKDWPETSVYLEERELRGYAYRPDHLPITLIDNRTVLAHCFVADPKHPHFAGVIAPDDAARIILNARGEAGLNRDYLINTIRALQQHGYQDLHLQDLLQRVLRLTGELDAGAGI
ncbi:MAG TPA: gamma-glutamylcyclotransferase [Rhodospirillaceae bacterium]|nr:gamma-glutamylcyclotransferase [Rhodospirillaceae bacterium]MAX60954.1 gamma-glutamylcyclotransferase [Rhodospirillaceae bacterium]MAX65276.1 gamma-glutamylcyclotransferase [Rhodospirillaceae bacterium]MBB55691.1 gamma-glutamylcyclotransferase [Rhodospirillaceae bacterium]HAJ20144.1 gamma-glutamylcyclotransferase [Rhodospirillaceae bacterium]